MKKISALLLAVFLMVSILSGCGNEGGGKGQGTSSTGETGEADDTLVVGAAGEPSSLDPHATSLSSANAAVQTSMFATLLEYDSDTGSFNPYIAESYEWVDPLTCSFVIRDDVYSQSGAHITAEDVLYSLRRGGSNPVLGNTYTYFDLDNSEVTGEYTLNIKVKEPNSGAHGTLGLPPCAIVAKADVEAVGEEEFARNPIGTGPYKLVEWTTGSQIVLERVDDFWGDEPYWSTITFKFIPDTNARSLALQSGDIDFAESMGASMLSTLENAANVEVHQSNIHQTQILWLNSDHEALKDVRVRYALEYALNKEAILQTVFMGIGKTADGIFNSESAQYAPPSEENNREYNVEKAKELLEEAGWGDGFTLSLKCYESTDYQNLLQAVQNQWAEIGVECTIDMMERGSFFAETYEGNFDVYTIHSVGAEPMGRVASFSSEVTRGNGNLTMIDNPRVDELIDLVNAELDEDARNEYYKEMCEVLRTECKFIPVCETMLISGARPGITDVKVGQTSYIMYYLMRGE